MEKVNCNEETIAIARGPNEYVKRYNAFMINGVKFHTKDREKRVRTQNSGVVVEVQEKNFTMDGIETARNYYGVIKDIYKLDYSITALFYFAFFRI